MNTDIEKWRPAEHKQVIAGPFPNGWGVSVINNGYGANDGLFEVAVLHGNDRHAPLCYKSPLLDDDAVKGWMTLEEVAVFISAVEKLPERPLCNHKASWAERR